MNDLHRRTAETDTEYLARLIFGEVSPPTNTETIDHLDRLLAQAVESSAAHAGDNFLAQVTNWHRHGVAAAGRSLRRHLSSKRDQDLADALWYARNIEDALAGTSRYVRSVE